jgi:putative restriction endonuclease
MPAVTPFELVQAIVDAVQDSGHAAILISKLRAHPREFLITSPDESQTLLWVYAWTLTHGGRKSLPHEYRVQLTTVKSPLPMNPHGPTVLIGYDPDLQAFAGFDLARHRTFTPGSASVQIDIRTVREALQDGLAFDRKTNAEIAVGIRSDQFMNYVYNAETLHRFGKQAATFGLLRKAAAQEDISVSEIEGLSQNRKRIVQTVSRLSRQANFRQQVMHAYGNRCAVTRAQLRLVDAAHILPVGAPGSRDDVRNGLGLSPTYHRAFDIGLIYLDGDLVMRINPRKERQLAALRLDGGLANFKSHLGKIHLPPDKRQYPNREFIREANRFRQIDVS